MPLLTRVSLFAKSVIGTHMDLSLRACPVT